MCILLANTYKISIGLIIYLVVSNCPIGLVYNKRPICTLKNVSMPMTTVTATTPHFPRNSTNAPTEFRAATRRTLATKTAKAAQAALQKLCPCIARQ